MDKLKSLAEKTFPMWNYLTNATQWDELDAGDQNRWLNMLAFALAEAQKEENNMAIGGYTGIPETLPEAQAMIVRLLDDMKKSSRVAFETMTTLNQAMTMIEAARKALNAVEVPATE
jgi:hypothetical protein